MNTVMLNVFYSNRDYPIQFDMQDAVTAERILQSIAVKLETQSVVTFAYGEFGQNVALITKDNLVFIKVTNPSLSPESDQAYVPSSLKNQWEKLDKVPDHKPDPIFPSAIIDNDAFFRA